MAFRQIIQSSKQLFAPATNFGQWYLATAKKHPFPTAFFTSGIKTSLADIIAQKVSSRVLRCIVRALSYGFPAAVTKSFLVWISVSMTCMHLLPQVVEKKEDFDWTRHAAFVTFGFAYLGSVQYYLYNVKFVQWCGGITAQVGHAGVAPLKTFMDQAIQ